MKSNLKMCGSCNNERKLWQSKPPLCYGCARKQAALKAIEKSKGEKPKFKPLTQTGDGKTAKVFKYIPKFNKKSADNLAKYRRLRDKYFIEHPTCEFPGCGSRKITLHHKRGRIGAFLTDKRYFCSLCHEHHVFVETHPAEAKKMGLSDSRLEKGVLLEKSA